MASAPKSTRAGTQPDLAYRVTDKDANTFHLGVSVGDVVGVTIGRTGPLPFRVVAVNAGHGRISLAPVGGEAPANLVTNEV